MSNEALETYLNDHLAGAAAVLDLVAFLEKVHPGTEQARFLARLHIDLTADRDELLATMHRLRVPESTARRTTGWLAEKLARLKLMLDDPARGALLQLEGIEAVSIGIEGKRALWLALAAVAAEVPALKVTDYERLRERAQEQRNRIEPLRLSAAKAALAPVHPTV